MRDPEQIAADLEHWVETSSRLLGKNLTPLLREAAEALREADDWRLAAGAEAQLADVGAAAVHDLNERLGKAEAERDALIAALRAIATLRYPFADVIAALPESVRQRIEQP